MNVSRGGYSNSRGSRRRLENIHPIQSNSQPTEDDYKLQALNDLGNQRREKITTDDFRENNLQARYAVPKPEAERKGTVEASRAQENKAFLTAWKSGLEDDDQNGPDLTDINQGQTHRANLTRTIKIEQADLRERGQEPNAENFDGNQFSQKTNHSRTFNHNLKNDINLQPRSSRPLDPAVDPDRAYGYKTGRKKPQNQPITSTKGKYPPLREMQLRTSLANNSRVRVGSSSTSVRNPFDPSRLQTNATTSSSTQVNSQHKTPNLTTTNQVIASRSSISVEQEVENNTSIVFADSAVGSSSIVGDPARKANSNIDLLQSAYKDCRATEDSKSSELPFARPNYLTEQVNSVELTTLNKSHPALQSGEAFWKYFTDMKSGKPSSKHTSTPKSASATSQDDKLMRPPPSAKDSIGRPVTVNSGAQSQEIPPKKSSTNTSQAQSAQETPAALTSILPAPMFSATVSNLVNPKPPETVAPATSPLSSAHSPGNTVMAVEQNLPSPGQGQTAVHNVHRIHDNVVELNGKTYQHISKLDEEMVKVNHTIYHRVHDISTDVIEIHGVRWHREGSQSAQRDQREITAKAMERPSSRPVAAFSGNPFERTRTADANFEVSDRREKVAITSPCEFETMSNPVEVEDRKGSLESRSETGSHSDQTLREISLNTFIAKVNHKKSKEAHPDSRRGEQNVKYSRTNHAASRSSKINTIPARAQPHRIQGSPGLAQLMSDLQKQGVNPADLLSGAETQVRNQLLGFNFDKVSPMPAAKGRRVNACPPRAKVKAAAAIAAVDTTSGSHDRSSSMESLADHFQNRFVL